MMKEISFIFSFSLLLFFFVFLFALVVELVHPSIHPSIQATFFSSVDIGPDLFHFRAVLTDARISLSSALPWRLMRRRGRRDKSESPSRRPSKNKQKKVDSMARPRFDHHQIT